MASKFTPFNPLDTVKFPLAKGILETNGVNPGEQLMVYNDSPCAINLHFTDVHTDIIPAYWNKDFIVPTVPMGKIYWDIDSTLNTDLTKLPISSFYGTLYEYEERVPSVNASMARIFTVGNPGGLPVSSNVLVNTTSAAGSVFVESKPTGQTNDSVTLTVDGILTIMSLLNGVLAQIVKTVASIPGVPSGSQDVLQLGALNYVSHILGQLIVDQDLAVTGSVKNNSIRDNTNGNLAIDLSAGTGAATFPKQVTLNDILNFPNGSNIDAKTSATEMDYTVPGTSKHTFEVGGGVRIIDIKSSGIGLYSNKTIGFSNGSLQRVGFAAFNPPSGLSTITHNFGFVPTIALWQGGEIANTNPGTSTAAIYNCLANTCSINNFAAIPGFLLYLQA